MAKKILISMTSLIFIGLITFGIVKFNQQIKHDQSVLDSTSLVSTYAQDLTAKAKAKANKKKPTIKDIALTVMNKETGLDASKTSYQQWGINTEDKFVKYGILSGDGIPYSSTMKTDSGQNLSLSNFDAIDKEYWKNIKDKDFKAVKNVVNSNLPKLNKKDAQLKEIQETINKAKKDDITNKEEIKSNQDKTSKPQDVK